MPRAKGTRVMTAASYQMYLPFEPSHPGRGLQSGGSQWKNLPKAAKLQKQKCREREGVPQHPPQRGRSELLARGSSDLVWQGQE